MTWAVGGTHLGCCRCIADNQATLVFPNGREKYYDVVRKVHEICPNLMISFAGNIKIGLQIIKLIKEEFIGTKNKKLFAQPEIIADKLLKYLRFTFNDLFNKNNKLNKIEFLIQISPEDFTAELNREFVNSNKDFFKKLKNGPIGPGHVKYMAENIRNSGFYFNNTLNLANKFVTIKTSSPNFKYSKIEFPLLGQIGSGSTIQNFQKIIKQHETLGFEQENPNSEKPDLLIPLGRQMLNYVAALASEISVRGVSKTMHIGIISTNGCTIQQFASPGVSFPETVDTWDGFKDFMKEKNIPIASCLAVG